MNVDKLDYAKRLYERIRQLKEILDKIEKMKQAQYIHIMEKDNKYCALAISDDIKNQVINILYDKYYKELEQFEKEFEEL
jgi:hypothetical protein